MAKKRRFSAYRRLETPYTRTSKFRAKAFIRMTKNPRIVRWNMGNQLGDYDFVYNLVSKEAIQVRDLAIESARMVANKVLETALGQTGYYFHLKVYPHHVLREHSLASGAGADRLSTGMARPFGKPAGIAAQFREGQEIMSIFVKKDNVGLAKTAFNKARTKLPGTYTIKIEAIKKGSAEAEAE